MQSPEERNGSTVRWKVSAVVDVSTRRFSYVTAESARRQSSKSAEKVLGSIMRTTMEPTNSSRVDHWSRCVQSRYVSSASGTDILTMYCQLR